jgi:hypothetical protein
VEIQHRRVVQGSTLGWGASAARLAATRTRFSRNPAVEITRRRRYASDAESCRTLLEQVVIPQFSVVVWCGVRWMRSAPVGSYGLLAEGGSGLNVLKVEFEGRAFDLAPFPVGLPPFAITCEEVDDQCEVSLTAECELGAADRLFASLVDVAGRIFFEPLGWFGLATQVYFDHELLLDTGEIPTDEGVYVNALRRVYEITYEKIYSGLHRAAGRPDKTEPFTV